MEIKELQKRALDIRAKYKILELKRNGKSWDRKDIMMGLVGDIGDLSKLVMASEGLRDIDDTESKLKHEISDCVWALFVLVDELDIEFEESFLRSMNELDERINNEMKQ
jgi:NTP pyrophosphatase (non-canonical NTP hydrolase)